VNGVPINFWQCEETGDSRSVISTGKGCDIDRRVDRLSEVFDMKLASFIVLLVSTASPVAAQTAGTLTSQVCSQDPTYCSDTGATQSTATGSGASNAASSGGSGGSGGSSGGGAGATPSIPNAPCGDGSPMDAWGACN
jgi:uncharacterized membrane protein YgcG